jgi:sulfate transport system ATP-binding protein
VNRLPCTVARGRAKVWNQEFGVDTAPVEQIERGLAYVRPEDIEIVARGTGGDGVRARVLHLSLLGPIVRVELQVHGLPDPVEAEVPRAKQRELGLRSGAEVLVRARAARVFTEAA